MQVEIVATGKTIHLDHNTALALIESGVAKKFDAGPKPLELTKWRTGYMGASGDYPPLVLASCPNCNQSQTVESKVGTAHKTILIRHVCGLGVETCPKEVADEYVALFKEWKSRARKPGRVERVSPYTK